jgi:hypothetical protein
MPDRLGVRTGKRPEWLRLEVQINFGELILLRLWEAIPEAGRETHPALP